MTHALVTGGAGLIGSHIVDLLLERGETVTVLDSLNEQTHPHGRPGWVPQKVRFIHGDVRDSEALDAALQGADTVYHQAAFGGFAPGLAEYFDANTTGTARLFEVIRNKRHGVRKVVLASSQAIFGEGLYRCEQHGLVHPPMREAARLERGDFEQHCPTCDAVMRPVPVHETVSTDTVTPYGLSKFFEERIGLCTGPTLGIPVVALRYAVTFGPRQSVHNPYTGVISIFSTRLRNGLPPVVFEDGLQTRDFVDVRDVARANLFVMDNEVGTTVFNVGNGAQNRMADLARKLGAIYGLDIEPEMTGAYRPGDVRHIAADSGRLRSLGFTFEHTLDDGLARYADWFRSLDDVPDRFGDAVTELRERGVIRGPLGTRA